MALMARLKAVFCGADEERYLAAAAFAGGAATMAVELTASRQLAPYFGASVFVWTSIIVCVLTAASVGYWFGGRLAMRNLGLRPIGLLLMGTGILAILGALLLPVFASLAFVLLAADGRLSGVFLGSLGVSAAVFAPPVFLATMLSPTILKRWSACRDVGLASSRFFMVSTFGSIVGTLTPTLVLVPDLGVSATVAIVAGTLLAVGLWLYSAGGGKRRLMAVLLLPLAFAVTPPFETLSGVIRRAETPYQLVRVLERDGKRYLTFNEALAVQSVYDPSDPVTGHYYDYFSLLPQLRPGHGAAHRAAIIGLAGGAAIRPYRLGAGLRPVDLTGVELDPAVTAIAEADLGLDPSSIRLVNADGRLFLRNSAGSYEAIVLDAYVNRHVAVTLATREAFESVKDRLAPGGAMAMNVIEYVPGDPLYRSLIDTIGSVFSHIAVVHVADSLNRIIFASDAPLDLAAAAQSLPPELDGVRVAAMSAEAAPPSGRGLLLTDDRAPVDFLSAEFSMARR